MKNEVKTPPASPGVYIFKDENNSVIYVGKAKNLSLRVKSYFQKNIQSPKTQVLKKHIKSADYIQTNTEVEALLLENKLIKEHSPKYNISLKDDKTYAYIKLTSEKIPKLQIARKTSSKGEYFGPFTDGLSRNMVLNILNKHYKLCTTKCTKNTSCLNYHIGFCSGANIGKEKEENYLEKIRKVKQILNGDIQSLKKEVTQNMQTASQTLDYETAKINKDVLHSLNILKKQQVDNYKQKTTDVISQIKTKTSAHYSLLKIRKGTILSKENYKVALDDKIFEKFLANYYYKRPIPKEILVSDEFWETQENKNNLEKYLEKLSNQKVKIIKPLRGDKKALIDLALKNQENLAYLQLNVLKQKLDLNKIPKVIECFDASNLQSNYITAAMVQYKDGQKSQFRKYKIKTTKTQDDYKALSEAIKRRLERLLQENARLPDLIIVDGGLGQLTTAQKVVAQLNLKEEVEVVSLAKKDEIIFNSNKLQVKLDKNKEPMLFIRSIRDATHRLAITYNRQLRKMHLKSQTKKFK